MCQRVAIGPQDCTHGPMSGLYTLANKLGTEETMLASMLLTICWPALCTSAQWFENSNWTCGTCYFRNALGTLFQNGHLSHSTWYPILKFEQNPDLNSFWPYLVMITCYGSCLKYSLKIDLTKKVDLKWFHGLFVEQIQDLKSLFHS